MRSIRGAERRGGGVWGGVSPPHGRRWRGSRSDARYPPVGEAPRTRTSRRNRCPYRSGNRAGCFSDGVCGGETLVRAIRGAERCGGGAWGGVSPPHGRRWRGSRSDARYPPVGEAPRTRTSRRNRCPYRSGNRAGCFSHGVLLVALFLRRGRRSPRIAGRRTSHAAVRVRRGSIAPAYPGRPSGASPGAHGRRAADDAGTGG